MRHIIIKIGETHRGDLAPGMLIVLPIDHVSFHGTVGVSFKNPLWPAGWSIGTKVGEVDLDIED